MRLSAVTIQKFKNIVEAQRVEIEPDVTGLVGKNESGKTTLLKALHRLNPANGTGRKFDLTTEYPRWRLARDRKTEDLTQVCPVTAAFVLEPADFDALEDYLPTIPPEGTVCIVARTYENAFQVWLSCDLDKVIKAAAAEVSLSDDDLPGLLECDSIGVAQTTAKEKAKELKESGELLRGKAMTSCVAALGRHLYLFDTSLIEQEALDAISKRLPKFFYFSNYDVLPGQCDLTALAEKIAARGELTNNERTVSAFHPRERTSRSQHDRERCVGRWT